MGNVELSRSVAGLRVVVTGAGSGMGAATARVFASEGAHVLLVDLNAEAVDRETARINGSGVPGHAAGLRADVADGGDRGAIVAACVAAFGGLDVLVNNAGTGGPTSVFGEDPGFTAEWDRILAVNLSAQAHLIRAALPHLLTAPNGGRVINIASTEAFVATGGLSAYTASKHGVVGLTKSFAVELGGRNVTVNAVCPGPIETQMTASIRDEDKAKYVRRRVPLGRYGLPEEVAHMTVSIAMPAMRYMTGSVIVVDGGLIVRH